MAARQAITPKPLPHSQKRFPGATSASAKACKTPYAVAKSLGTKPGTRHSDWKRWILRSASRRKRDTSAGSGEGVIDKLTSTRDINQITLAVSAAADRRPARLSRDPGPAEPAG